MYSVTVDLPCSSAEAIELINDALSASGMRVAGDVNVQSFMRHRQSSREWAPGQTLTLHSPALMQTIHHHDPDVAALLPCRGLVRELDNGLSRVMLCEPMGLVTATREPEVIDALAAASAALQQAVDDLKLAAAGALAGR